MTEKSNRRGGSRVGAGRKRGIRKRLELNDETAKDLYRLTKYRRALFAHSDLSEEQVVGQLIDAAWKAVQQSLEVIEEVQPPYIV